MQKNRRILHQPFFPTTSSPPSQPPSPSPPFPKYPFSSNPTKPFFPDYPSPPSPPSPSPPSTSANPSLPTFPANISSLIYPNSQNAPAHPPPHRLLPAILFSLLGLSLLILASAFFFHRRRRRSSNHHSFSPDPTRSDVHKLATSAPTNSTSAHPAASANSSDFLYLGTLVNSRAAGGQNRHPSQQTNAVPSPKLGSPELHPLPPLSRQVRHNHGNATGGNSEEDEEFYSPRADSSSAAEKFAAVKCGSRRSSDTSSPSYPTSSGSGSPASSPDRSSPVLDSSPANSGSKISRSGTSPPPGPPLPPPPRVGGNATSRIPHPPPPPPPPSFGTWESQIRNPPILVSPTKSPEAVTAQNSEALETTPRPKLKPLHWDKVRASSDRAMVWDQLKSSSFQVNEEMIESLFGCNNTSSVPAKPKEVSKNQVLPSPNQENRVLDPKKSQNIAILLRALNVTKEEVCEDLLDGSTDSLGTDLLETLLKMAPTKEEELKLKEYNDDSPFKLGPAEKFLKAMLDIPFAFKRVDAMLYIANFDSEVSYLKNSFETLEAACEELRNSRLFFKLLEAVLKTGNRMNVGTNRGDAHAFKLDTLLKLVDVKGTDGNTTLLHFVVQEIIRTEGARLSASRTQANTLKDDLECKKRGLKVVAGLGGELSNVKKAAAMDSEVLSSYVSKLAGGIGKIAEVLRLNEVLSLKDRSQRFNEAMNVFLKKAEDEIIKVQAHESVALSLVKEITEYFHGNSAKEEAHPFRIFMVVRDFLSTLDQVCKEVGRINERTIANSARQFPVPVNPTLPPLFPRIQALRPEVSDDETSSSSSSS